MRLLVLEHSEPCKPRRSSPTRRRHRRASAKTICSVLRPTFTRVNQLVRWGTLRRRVENCGRGTKRSTRARAHGSAQSEGGLRHRPEGGIMWWAIGFGGLLYLILVFTLGLMTIRNGHGWMFFFGIFFPLLWIIGAFMQPTDRAASDVGHLFGKPSRVGSSSGRRAGRLSRSRGSAPSSPRTPGRR